MIVTGQDGRVELVKRELQEDSGLLGFGKFGLFQFGYEHWALVDVLSVLRAHTWLLDITQDEVPVPTMPAEWQERVIGLRGWEGTIEAFFDPNDPGRDFLEKALWGEKPPWIAFVFRFFEESGGYYEGEGVVTQLQEQTDVGEAIAVSFDFKGIGQLKYTS